MGTLADKIKNGRKQAEQPATPSVITQEQKNAYDANMRKPLMQPATPPAAPITDSKPQEQTQTQAEQQEKVEFTPQPSLVSEEAKAEHIDAMRNEHNEAIAPKKDYDYVFGKLRAENATNAAEKNEKLRKQQERRENRGKIFRAIGDGVSALANLYFTTQGAPAVQYDPRGSLSARDVARYDKMEALRREDEQRQYLREKAARDAELRYLMEERLRNQEEGRNTRQEEKIAADKETQEDRQAHEAEQTKAKFEQQDKHQAQGHENTLEQIAARGQNSLNVAAKKAEMQAENKANKTKKDAEAISAEFHSLPKEVQEAALKKYGARDSYGDLKRNALTPSEMQQAIGEYNASQKPKDGKTKQSKGFSWVNKSNNITKVNW
jgi:hypothetical protein